MINGLKIYYSRKISGSGLKPVSNNNNKQTILRKANELKPISKGGSCKKYGRGLKILQ